MSRRMKFSLVTALTAVVLTLVMLVAFSNITVYAEAQSSDTSSANVDVDAFVKELSELNATDKTAVVDHLMDKFRSALGEPSDISNEDSNVKKLYFPDNYHNIEARIDRGTDKQIIIGAHYDSKYAGASDNACGVAALYLTMKILKLHESELPYSVTFVAFDGEEDGLLGSKEYVKNNIQDKSKVLVMFNIDSIGLGDKMYLMCENKSTDLAKLILSKSSLIEEKPHAKGIYGSLDEFGYGYYEFVQGSDHTPFRLQGIPVAFFFSGTFNIWGYAESSDSSKLVINTNMDTYDNLKASGVDFVERIEAVADAISETVLDGKFTTVAENARSQLVNLNLWYNVWWPRIAVAAILLILVVLTVLYSRKLQKNAILGTAEIKTEKVFEKPPAEDIFTFKK